MAENTLNILENVKIAVANNGGHLSAVDAGALSVLYRLSILIDVKFDTGDTSDLSQLIARHVGLMDALLLTPKSRNLNVTQAVQDTDHGKEFSETYLRLVSAPVAVKARKRSEPRSTGGTTGGKPKPAVDGVAKTRNGSGTSNRSRRKVD
jgi:hypothetical protein